MASSPSWEICLATGSNWWLNLRKWSFSIVQKTLLVVLKLCNENRNSNRNLLYFHTLCVHLQPHVSPGADPGGGPWGPGPPPDPRFWGPKIEHFWALFNFSLIFFASLRSAYYFFNMLLFQSSNSKIFQPRFAWHMISHLEVFVFSLSFTHFRLLGVHLSLSFF